MFCSPAFFTTTTKSLTVTRFIKNPSFDFSMDASRVFRRAEKLFGDTETVTEREVVNVLGRWQDTSDWNNIGLGAELDAILAKDGPLPLPKGKVIQERTPQRRKMLQKMGQVQRFLLVENVPTLPFTDEPLAASVGATAKELDAEPVSALALEVVFDALTASKSSFANKTDANLRRASYRTADGAFSAAAFGEDLAKGRVAIFSFAAVFYGTPNLIGAALAYKAGWFASVGDAVFGGSELFDLDAVLSSPLLYSGLMEPLVGRTPGGLAVPNLVGIGAYLGLFGILFVLLRSQVMSKRDRQSSPLQSLLEKDEC